MRITKGSILLLLTVCCLAFASCSENVGNSITSSTEVSTGTASVETEVYSQDDFSINDQNDTIDIEEDYIEEDYIEEGYIEEDYIEEDDYVEDEEAAE